MRLKMRDLKCQAPSPQFKMSRAAAIRGMIPTYGPHHFDIDHKKILLGTTIDASPPVLA